MHFKKANLSAGRVAACAMLGAVMTVSAVCGAVSLSGFAESETEVYYNKIASFDTGSTSADGGTAEIVHYNSDNGKMYLVNGAKKAIDIIAIEQYGDGARTVFDENTDRVYIDDIVAQNSQSFAEGFEAGEISSVAVSTQLKTIAVAVQNSGYAENGAVVLLDYDGKFIAAYQTGVQPDNVVFGGNYVLTADEGEPREGYVSGTDPKGSVTIVSNLTADNLTEGTAEQVYFDDFDSQRDELTQSGVIIMKGADPSTDFEPEYIVTNGVTAYVSLQEANAIAILDIASGTFTAVQSLGFKDHSIEGNGLDLINDNAINIKTENVYGVYMPDGMDLYTAADGTTYLVTANEGDAREWGEFSGVTKQAFTDGDGNNSTKVEVLDNSLWDGLDEDKTYVLGGRSFSVFKVTNNSIEMVYDSGDGIEQTIAASDYAAYFNCNSDDVSLDARSKKKGPEPEDVAVYEYNGAVCVSVCLERQSGFVSYDISGILTGESVTVTDLGYTTTRDFTADMAGDVAPENLEYVAAANNALGKDLIIMANENSGTVSVYAIEDEQKTYTMQCDYTEAEKQSGNAAALITEVFATGNNTDGAFNYSFITIANNSGEQLDLSGWSIQYKSGTDDWQAYTLKTVLNAGGTYTIVCSGASGTYSNRVMLSESNYDAVWSDLAYLDNKDLSIKIVDAEGNTIDALGVYDSTNGEEGEGALLSGISKQKVVKRNTDESGAYIDTDDNASDFTISNTSKTSTADDYADYIPDANADATATVYITVNADSALVTGIEYLASGYVLAGEVNFTVTAIICHIITGVTVGGVELSEDNGVYTFAATDNCEITVSAQTNHTAVTDEAVAATCTQTGLTEGSHCSVCGVVITMQTPVPATGHSFNEDGICTVCGDNVITFELNEGGTYTVTGICDKTFTKVVIPSEYNGTAVTAIAANAFKNNAAITYLYIPASITQIGNYAFYGCSNLTEIYYGAADVTLAASNYIFYQAGQSGDGIAVTIGNTVNNVPAYLFNPYGTSVSNAPKVVSVTFEENSICQSVGDRAFAFCNYITAVAFPDSVNTLGEYLFYGCSALESASFGTGMTTIGTHVFASCTALKTVTFANTFGWYKGQSTTMSNNGYAVNQDVSDGETNAANFIESTGGWLSYKLIRTDNVICYYVDDELYGAACYSTAITSKQFTNLKSAISVTSVPSKQCYKGSWDTSVTYKTLQSGGLITVNAVYTVNHTIEHVEAVAATCTQNGNTEYWYCSECGKYFSDENGAAEIEVENTVIAAAGHGLEHVEAVAATCTQNGNTEYWYCSECGKYFSDENGTAEIEVENTVIAAEGHGLEHVEAVAATCAQNGNTEYWYCSECGKYFSDENGAAEIEVENTVIAAKGHKYESVVTEPTCTEQGYTTHTCSECGDSYVDGYTEAAGHNYTVESWTWDGYSSAAAVLVCANDGSHTQTVTAVITSEITTAATQTTAGVRTYTATITFDGETYTATKTESIPATGTSDSGEQSDKTDTTDTDVQSGSGCATILSGGGNSSNGDMFMVLAAVSALAMAFMVNSFKRRQSK